MGDGAVVGCASLRGLHRLHAYEVYSTSRKCCCRLRVAQLQPELELTSGAAALGRALRLLSDGRRGGKTLSCSNEPDTTALARRRRQRAGETGENSSRCSPLSWVEVEEDRWSRCLVVLSGSS